MTDCALIGAYIITGFVATSFFVSLLSTVILGISKNVSWAYPLQLVSADPYLVLKGLAIYFILIWCTAFIPIGGLNKLLHNLTYGGICLVYILLDYSEKGIVTVDGSLILVPLGYNLLVFVLVCILSIVLGTVLTALMMSKTHKKGIAFIQFSLAIHAISLFVPLFTYGSWLSNKL